MKKLSKILTWVALAVGLVSIVLIGMMLNYGDGTSGESSCIDALFAITWALFGLSAVAICFFVVKTWIQSPKTLVSTLPYLLGFVAVLAASYFLADSTPTVLFSGKVSTEGESLVADFGIWATYILGAIVILCLVFGGFLKSLKK